MKSLRSGISKWNGARFLGVAVSLCSIAAFGAPPDRPADSNDKKTPPSAASERLRGTEGRAAKKAQAKPSGSASVSAAVPKSDEPTYRGESADIYPTTGRAVAPDLALSDEHTRKAEAMATFAKALLSGDAAEKEKELEGYKRTLALDPGCTELAVQVAYELAKRNDVPTAIQILKDSIKAAPKEPLPLIYLSQLYAKHLKKPELGLKYAEQALTLAPDNIQAHLAMYEMQMATGQPKKAEEVLERASRSKSTEPQFWIQLGDLYTRLYLKDEGNSDPAQVQRMNAVFKKAAELGKSDPLTLSKVGDYFILSRQIAEAIPYYQNALRLRGSGDEPALSNLREKLGHAYRVTQQRDQAIEVLEADVRENPMRYGSYELLGELYLQKGDTEKAMRHFEQSLLIDSSRAENYIRLAELYIRLKQSGKAVETMRTARGKFTDSPQVSFVLAVALSQAKKHTEAMTAFAEARAEAEQSNPEMLTATFFFQYGAAAEQADLIEKAAELLRECIRLDPSNAAEAYNYLGYMWADRGMNLDEADSMIRKALELEPDNGAYLDSLGWLHFKRGNYDQAQKDLLRAVENMSKEDAVVFEHLGDTCEKLGKKTEALGYWQRSLALEDNPKVREKIEAAKQASGQPATVPATAPSAPPEPAK